MLDVLILVRFGQGAPYSGLTKSIHSLWSKTSPMTWPCHSTKTSSQPEVSPGPAVLVLVPHKEMSEGGEGAGKGAVAMLMMALLWVITLVCLRRDYHLCAKHLTNETSLVWVGLWAAIVVLQFWLIYSQEPKWWLSSLQIVYLIPDQIKPSLLQCKDAAVLMARCVLVNWKYAGFPGALLSNSNTAQGMGKEISNLGSAYKAHCSCSMERIGAPTEEKWWTALAPPPPPAPEQAAICHHTMAHLGSTLLTCGPPYNWQMESLWLVTIVALQSSYHHQSRDWISWIYFCQWPSIIIRRANEILRGPVWCFWSRFLIC